MPIDLKNDYFKHSTRRLLSDEQKLDMIEAALRGLGVLDNSKRRETFYQSPDGRRMKLEINIMMRRIDQGIMLVKGKTQCPHLYRRRRRNDVWIEARKISKATGAPFKEVYETLLQMMGQFIGATP
jgi:hypothetical protein